MLLEWLADAEQSLRFHGPLSEDKEVITEQLQTLQVNNWPQVVCAKQGFVLAGLMATT